MEQGFLDESGLTAEGQKQLAPYRVDNAIIMAAGYSARCMPLSNVMPKGLFKVKGEILIEREIRQLLDVAGRFRASDFPINISGRMNQ